MNQDCSWPCFLPKSFKVKVTFRFMVMSQTSPIHQKGSHLGGSAMDTPNCSALRFRLTYFAGMTKDKAAGKMWTSIFSFRNTSPSMA